MSRPARVALLVTCIIDQVLPEVGIATVRLLRRAGFEVDFPGAQTCCGQPFYNSGFQDEARRLARRTIEIFEPYEAVVLPSGSCTAMIRKEYAHLFETEPDWYARARALGARTYELTEFLKKFDALPTVGAHEIASVTYHDSCHMCRSLGLKAEPREALKKAGLDIIEMPEPDRCCGFGGLFSVKMPEVSRAITARKTAEAAGTGAGRLVTADPGCLMQIRQTGGIQAEHIAVVLEERTR